MTTHKITEINKAIILMRAILFIKFFIIILALTIFFIFNYLNYPEKMTNVIGTVVNTTYDQTYEGVKPKLVIVLDNNKIVVVDIPRHLLYKHNTKIKLVKIVPRYFGKTSYALIP